MDAEAGCSGEAPVGGDEACVKMAGEDDVEGVRHGDVRPESPGFGDEWLDGGSV